MTAEIKMIKLQDITEFQEKKIYSQENSYFLFCLKKINTLRGSASLSTPQTHLPGVFQVYNL